MSPRSSASAYLKHLVFFLHLPVCSTHSYTWFSGSSSLHLIQKSAVDCLNQSVLWSTVCLTASLLRVLYPVVVVVVVCSCQFVSYLRCLVIHLSTVLSLYCSYLKASSLHHPFLCLHSGPKATKPWQLVMICNSYGQVVSLEEGEQDVTHTRKKFNLGLHNLEKIFNCNYLQWYCTCDMICNTRRNDHFYITVPFFIDKHINWNDYVVIFAGTCTKPRCFLKSVGWLCSIAVFELNGILTHFSHTTNIAPPWDSKHAVGNIAVLIKFWLIVQP